MKIDPTNPNVRSLLYAGLIRQSSEKRQSKRTRKIMEGVRADG